MEKMNNELLEKAREAKSAEEILALAKENNVPMTEEQAKAVYAKFHPVSGEIEDDELENVAGGGCGQNYDYPERGDTVICSKDKCPKCGGNMGVYDYFTQSCYNVWWATCANCKDYTYIIAPTTEYLGERGVKKA